MSTGKVVLGVLAGVATGALIAVLFAPDKGTETRKKISKKGRELTDELKDKIEEVIDHITKKCDHIKDEVVEEVKE
jgi:gas vesicle protein